MGEQMDQGCYVSRWSRDSKPGLLIVNRHANNQTILPSAVFCQANWLGWNIDHYTHSAVIIDRPGLDADIREKNVHIVCEIKGACAVNELDGLIFPN